LFRVGFVESVERAFFWRIGESGKKKRHREERGRSIGRCECFWWERGSVEEEERHDVSGVCEDDEEDDAETSAENTRGNEGATSNEEEEEGDDDDDVDKTDGRRSDGDVALCAAVAARGRWGRAVVRTAASGAFGRANRPEDTNATVAASSSSLDAIVSNGDSDIPRHQRASCSTVLHTELRGSTNGCDNEEKCRYASCTQLGNAAISNRYNDSDWRSSCCVRDDCRN